MLLYLRCANFFSFANQVDVSFEVGKKPAETGYDCYLANKRLNKVIAVIGANGSGKTSLLKPLGFIRWLISGALGLMEPEETLPWSAHLLHEEKPGEFELGFVCDAIEYRYELSILNGKIVREALYQKTSRAFSYVFIRGISSDTGEWTFKQKGFGLSASALQQRDNVSALCFARQFDVPLATRISDYFEAWVTNLSFHGRHNFERKQIINVAEFYLKNPDYLRQVNQAISEFDLGIDRIEIRQIESLDENDKNVSFPVPMAFHSHGKGEFSLPLFAESSGTQSAFVLLRRVLPVLNRGGVAIIDEIDNDLHPHMLTRILDWFRDPSLNTNHAQLIFSCHSPEVLNLLMKHQVYLVEKREQESEAWRLDEVEGLRADDNLYAKYMAGALSAVPEFG